jgi:hypothetical protein
MKHRVWKLLMQTIHFVENDYIYIKSREFLLSPVLDA